MNGIALHGGFIPYGGTFLVFSDYARNAVRLACLMSMRVILVYTHDSIGLGEDGPTHQPIEHLSSLRAMPHMSLWRPCDAAETAVAWTLAIERHGPTALVLTRQALPQQPRTAAQLADIRRGGYVLIDCQRHAGGLVIATGSEVGIAAQAVNARQRAPAGACAWCRCPRPRPSMRRMQPTASACCRARSRAAWRWRRAPRRAGGATSAATAGCSASTTSAPPARGRMCSLILASPPIMSRQQIRELLEG